MTREQLQDAIRTARQRIDQINDQLEKVTDQRERRQLLNELKDLQYLQFWQREQLEHLGDG